MSKRVQWIDIAKGIGIALVIIGHTLLSDSVWRKVVFSFHMPLFFILAGYTFRAKPFKEAFQSSFQRLLVPFCLIFLARLIITVLRAESFDLNLLASQALSFIYASGAPYNIGGWQIPAAGMIWFLMALFLSRLLLNGLLLICQSRNVRESYQMLLVVFLGFLGVLIGEPSKTCSLFAFSQSMPAHIMLPMSFDVVLVATLFMYIGYLFRTKNLNVLLSKWYTVPCALCAWALCFQFSYFEFAARRYDFWVCGIVAACAGSYLVMWLSRLVEVRMTALSKPLTWLGVNSLLLFCIHVFDIYFTSWQTLPIIDAGILPHAILVVGLLRFGVDVLIASVVRRL